MTVKTQPLGRDSWWLAIGWLMIICVTALSLLPAPQLPSVTGWDKANHFLAYGSMMFWWGMLRPDQRVPWAIGLMMMGLALELLQSATPERYMEWQDAVANGIGIAVAFVVLSTRARGLLGAIDGLLSTSSSDRGDRGDSSLP